MSEPDPDLSALDPQLIAAWLLHGRLSPLLPLWESFEEPHRTETLSHLRWRKVFSDENLAPNTAPLWAELLTGPTPTPQSPLAIPEASSPIRLNPQPLPLFHALTQALANPSPESLQHLENEEQAWALKTEKDLVWEAYRISIHGLSVTHLQNHLQARQIRLHRALWEIEMREKVAEKGLNGVK
jgi:hypothetical protein